MQLHDLEPAWKQFKLSNAMYPVESKEILAIIEISRPVNRSRLVLLNQVMFVMIMMFCQGG